MCFEPRTGANLPNTEVFINACVAWALALWLPAPLSQMSWRRCASIALLFALASLYKQVAIVIPLCVGVAEMLTTARAGRPSHGMKLATLFAIVAVVWIARCSATSRSRGAVGSRGRRFSSAPRAYSGGMIANLAASLLPQKMFSQYLLFALPALALTILAPFRVPWRERLMLIGLLLGTHLAVALPGQFHWHYYQLWFVPLSIGAGWEVAAVLNMLGPRRRRLPMQL